MTGCAVMEDELGIIIGFMVCLREVRRVGRSWFGLVGVSLPVCPNRGGCGARLLACDGLVGACGEWPDHDGCEGRGARHWHTTLLPSIIPVRGSGLRLPQGGAATLLTPALDWLEP